MLLLVVDTSGKNGSLALARARDSGRDLEVIETVPLAGGTFSAQMVPQIATLLVNNGYSKSDLAGFAVVSGPGSFTGLRVGLAAVKALAEILRKPIAAVSLLEAVARNGPDHGRVLSLLDAGRGDMYVGDYDVGPPPRLHSQRLLSREKLLAESRGRVVFTPDARIAEVVRAAGIRVELVKYPGADVIARLGWDRIQRGETVDPAELEANYIRHSDAEIFSKPKP